MKRSITDFYESGEDCLRLVSDIIEEELAPEDPPTELELAEMQAQAEGWGPEFRAALWQKQLDEEAEQERQQERARKRKRELDLQAQWKAEKAEAEKREQERKRMFANDEVELKNEAEREEKWRAMMKCFWPDGNW